MAKTLGILLTTWDGDRRWFSQILDEFTRLGYPFVMNFDHCSWRTKSLFKAHPLFLDCYENNNPNDPFDERHKGYALDLLVKHGFDWGTYLDTDDRFDRRAPQIIPEILAMDDVDWVWCPALDLWGDGSHYRVDGPLGPSPDFDYWAGDPSKQRRDCFWNLKTGDWRYLHGDVHAPYFFAKDGSGRQARRHRSRLHVVHYGRMNPKVALEKEDMWDRIYTRCLGKNRYKGGFYVHVATHEPELVPFDYDTFDGD